MGDVSIDLLVVEYIDIDESVWIISATEDSYHLRRWGL